MAKKINKIILSSLVASAIVTPISYSCSATSSNSSNNNGNLLIDNDESINLTNDDSTNSKLLRDKYKRKLNDNSAKYINDCEERANKYINSLKTKKSDLKVELNSILKKILDTCQNRYHEIDLILAQESNKNLTFEEKVNLISKVFDDKNLIVSDIESNKELSVELFLSKERYLNELSETYIQKFVGELRSNWLDMSQTHVDVKVTSFMSFFVNLDLFKSLYYELLVFPFLFKEVNGVDFFSFLTQNSKDGVYDETITSLYNIWKNVDLFNRELKYFDLSPTTKESYWFAWLKSIDFHNSYEASGILLVDQNYKIENNPIINDGTNKFYESILPKNINQNNSKDIESYVNEILIKLTPYFSKEVLDANPEAKKQIEKYLDDVFNRIIYINNEFEYSKKYSLNKIDLNKDFEEFKNEFNNTLMNKDLAIKSDEELNACNLDFLKSSGIRFVNNLPEDNPDSFTDKDLLKDLEAEENQYLISSFTNNLKRKNIVNTHIRKIDFFKTLYFEMSIFPYLIRLLTGWNYEQWCQLHNNDYSNYPYKKYNVNWLLDRYIVYRDWNINMSSRIHGFKTEITRLKNLEPETEQSSWYKWINSIDFKKSYIALTGVIV